jgi:hypothetical protein
MMALVAAIFIWRPDRSPAEVARLSESLVVAKVRAYYQDPRAANLAAVREVVTTHRKIIQRADLAREAREALEQNLNEQILIVCAIAHNYDLKL